MTFKSFKSDQYNGFDRPSKMKKQKTHKTQNCKFSMQITEIRDFYFSAILLQILLRKKYWFLKLWQAEYITEKSQWCPSMPLN